MMEMVGGMEVRYLLVGSFDDATMTVVVSENICKKYNHFCFVALITFQNHDYSN